MSKKNTLLSVTVGIPAYNEAAHIVPLLQAINTQKQTNFLLEKLIVICDGGTDETPTIVKNFAKDHPYVTCIVGEKNKGKSERLNELYSLNTSDILITLDADSIPGNPDTFDNIVKAFTDSKVGLVGGHDEPLQPKTFFEKIACTAINIWYETRKDINAGDTVHNHHGCISAVSKSFASKIHIPKNVTSDDEYLYFAALKSGFSFKFAKDALLYYRAPATLRDYLIQSSRFIDTKHQIISLFGDWVAPFYPIARKYKIKGLLIMMKREPLFTPLAIMVQLLVRVTKPLYERTYTKGKWTRISSTKML